ncbi:MAG: RNA polymerase sigma-70 factor [Bacteroidales bacterium]|nr:RNA polymerase sigma-70 factor [Bacteroidales bacterium]
MQENDHEILQALKQSDENALKLIFHLHFSHMHFFVSEFVIDREVAREIVHDAFMRFWQHRFQLKEDTRIKAYLFKIVRNLSLNYLTKVKNNPEYLLSPDELRMEMDMNYELLADSGWDDLLVQEFREVLAGIIDKLPEKCRIVFEMSRNQQFTNQEIADQLNISVKTVEGHITDALKILRLKLDKYLKIILFLIIP